MFETIPTLPQISGVFARLIKVGAASVPKLASSQEAGHAIYEVASSLQARLPHRYR